MKKEKEKEKEGALARWTKREQKECDTSDTEIYGRGKDRNVRCIIRVKVRS